METRREDIPFEEFVSAVPNIVKSRYYADMKMLAALDHNDELTVYRFGSFAIFKYSLGKLEIKARHIDDAYDCIDEAVTEWVAEEARNNF